MADKDGPPPEKEVSALFDRHLARHAAPGRVAGLNDEELHGLFEAAYVTTFMTAHRRHVLALETVATELERRALLTAQDAQDLQGVYIRGRDFDSARRLAEKFPTYELERVPMVSGALLPSSANVMELSADGSVLQLRSFPQTRGPRIVIISSLSCGPSNRALGDIKSDPTVGPIFGKHASWVVPPQSGLDADKMAEWNQENPDFHFRHAYSGDGWVGIDTWNETPVFYFLMDGKQAAKVVGWPKNGRWDELRAGLKAIGLL